MRTALRPGKRPFTRRLPEREMPEGRERFCETELGLLPALLQVLEPQQHREGPLQLAVEMHLVSAESLQLVRIKRLAKGLLSDERPARNLLLSLLEPGQHVTFDEASKALNIGRRRDLVFPKFSWFTGKLIGPPAPSVFPEPRKSCLVRVVESGVEKLESATRDCLVRRHIGKVLLRLGLGR